MVNQLSIRFFLRRDQILESSRIPIYARVILDRDKFDFSSKQYIESFSDWDEITGRVKKKSPINSVLAEIEHEVNWALMEKIF